MFWGGIALALLQQYQNEHQNCYVHDCLQKFSLSGYSIYTLFLIPVTSIIYILLLSITFLVSLCWSSQTLLIFLPQDCHAGVTDMRSFMALGCMASVWEQSKSVLRGKAPALSDCVITNSIDLLGIAETLLTTRKTSADLIKMTPPGFSFFHNPRAQRRGGGVGLFILSAHTFT